MDNILKVRITGNTVGELHATVYGNQRIHGSLMLAIGNAIHEAISTYKGDRNWRETYFKFTDENTGIRYEQVGQDTGNPCKECIFWSSNKCNHPYHDIKGTCTKSYRVESL